MKLLVDIIKELTEVVRELNKLAIELIGLIGWILIIHNLLN